MEKIFRIKIGVVTGVGILFLTLAFLVRFEFVMSIDKAVYGYVSELISESWTRWVIFVTNLGDLPYILVLPLILLIHPKTRRPMGFPISVTLLYANTLHALLKRLIQRPRPDILRLVQVGNYSFPSGHMTNNMALYTIFVFVLYQYTPNQWIRRTGLAFSSLWVLSIGLSRIYLGVHYFSDIVGGALVGFFVAFMIFWSLEGDR